MAPSSEIPPGDEAEFEWRRLVKDAYHRVELEVTLHYLAKHLPPSGHLLDAGAGPGRYALDLCRRGYLVTLLDASDEMVRAALYNFSREPADVRARLDDAVVGDIRDLSAFASRRFDAVLCLGGALSYCGEESEHRAALCQLVRVAKPGAVVAISVMGYLALLRTILMRFGHELLDRDRHELLVIRGNSRVRGHTWHFFRAEELRQLAESCGLVTLEMAGCEGLSSGLAEATNALARHEDQWRRWMDILLATASEPAVVDTAEHLLYLGTTPPP